MQLVFVMCASDVSLLLFLLPIPHEQHTVKWCVLLWGAISGIMLVSTKLSARKIITLQIAHGDQRVLGKIAGCLLQCSVQQVTFEG